MFEVWAEDKKSNIQSQKIGELEEIDSFKLSALLKLFRARQLPAGQKVLKVEVRGSLAVPHNSTFNLDLDATLDREFWQTGCRMNKREHWRLTVKVVPRIDPPVERPTYFSDPFTFPNAVTETVTDSSPPDSSQDYSGGGGDFSGGGASGEW